MIELIIFYSVSSMLILLSCVVAFVQHPVRQILSLIAVFVLMSILWLLTHAEFLALLLIFVYVGAVMTLFLYMVMMFNADKILENKRPFFFGPAEFKHKQLSCGLCCGSFLSLPHDTNGIFRTRRAKKLDLYCPKLSRTKTLLTGGCL